MNTTPDGSGTATEFAIAVADVILAAVAAVDRVPATTA